MLISVIIPTYKPQEYLLECLDSLRIQTIGQEKFEIILVLNGCNDPYDALIKKWIKDNPSVQINYVQTDTPGVSNARNIALNIACGDYICFVDDDDYVSPSYLDELYAKSDNETIPLSNAFAFQDGKPETRLSYAMSDAFDMYSSNGRMSSSKVRKFFSGPCMKLINRSIIQGRKFDVRFKNGEDSLFMFLISDRVKYVDFTSPNAIYYRRYRENSAIMVKKKKSYVIANSLKLMGAYTRIFLSNPFRYSVRRYLHAILGAIHYVIVNI